MLVRKKKVVGEIVMSLKCVKIYDVGKPIGKDAKKRGRLYVPEADSCGCSCSITPAIRYDLDRLACRYF